ncbi:hypothetical protein AALB16_15755 [Lachnospiraceae bacterium 62-35]
MKKIVKLLFSSMIMGLLCSTSIFAEEIAGNEKAEATEIKDAVVREIINNGVARVGATVRGEWLADVVLQISNPQNGNIGVLMTTTCQQPVDKIVMGLYIDKMRDDKHWDQVDYKIFEFLPEDFPDGILSVAVIDIELTGFELGFYRLRSMHLVTSGKFDEFYSAETGFIEITKRFPFSNEATPNEVSPSEATIK